MEDKQKFRGEAAENYEAMAVKAISWSFGVVTLAIGFVNTFWGNDPGFGVFIILLSLIYFLPLNAILKKMIGLSIPKLGILKILLGIFIVWAAMGVGELFDKIHLMLNAS